MSTIAGAGRAPLAMIANGQEWLLRSIESILGPNGYAVMRAYDGKQAIEQTRAGRPDIVLLDVALPALDGFEVCRQMRDDAQIGRSTPILLTATTPWSRAERLQALRSGAWDMLSLPLDTEELLLRLDVYVQAKLHAERGREAGLVDYATGLYNPQGLVRRISEMAGEAERERRGLACIVLAPELRGGRGHTGHGVADAADDPEDTPLDDIGRTFRAGLRVYDALGRVGQGEFVVLAPNTGRDGAMQIATRLAHLAEQAVGEDDQGELLIRAGCYAVDDMSTEGVSPVSMLVRATTALRASQGSAAAAWLQFYEPATS